MTKHYDYIAIGGGSGGIARLTAPLCTARNARSSKPKSWAALC
ncbi:Uncharacterised protein [Salmonella enterica subsp. enterica]|nr:Uncharacterised protein [Salmonella enterica subsp. enterica] [Salmonella enterica subsp. enterica serovar Menston]